ncbi:MAG: calcium/sodium antiporter [Planctomycetia bacterium]|nr:calcium/sodium antiporter [Planctomycetia bacterium]
MLTVSFLIGVFVAGAVVLYYGAEATLLGAVSIATRMGISQLVIGLTLVAFGTSCPELSLDVSAALKGQTELAFGDLVGSNIANIGLILGLAAVLCPLHVQMRLLRAELPIVIAVSILVLALAWDGVISRQDGLFMLAGFVLFTGYSYRAARQESRSVRREIEGAAEVTTGNRKSLLLIVLGLAGLVAGAQLMVYAAVEMARLIGVSELIIGLTIVALGTSLPELATSVVAARRGDADIVVGNVIGSNIFNLLLILALVAVIHPVPVEARSLYIDLPVMIAFAVALVPIMLRGMVVSRNEGLFLVAGMLAFLGWQLYSAIVAH